MERICKNCKHYPEHPYKNFGDDTACEYFDPIQGDNKNNDDNRKDSK
jgi:hypothetical protein